MIWDTAERSEPHLVSPDITCHWFHLISTSDLVSPDFTLSSYFTCSPDFRSDQKIEVGKHWGSGKPSWLQHVVTWFHQGTQFTRSPWSPICSSSKDRCGFEGQRAHLADRTTASCSTPHLHLPIVGESPISPTPIFWDRFWDFLIQHFWPHRSRCPHSTNFITAKNYYNVHLPIVGESPISPTPLTHHHFQLHVFRWQNLKTNILRPKIWMTLNQFFSRQNLRLFLWSILRLFFYPACLIPHI